MIRRIRRRRDEGRIYVLGPLEKKYVNAAALVIAAALTLAFVLWLTGIPVGNQLFIGYTSTCVAFAIFCFIGALKVGDGYWATITHKEKSNG